MSMFTNYLLINSSMLTLADLCVPIHFYGILAINIQPLLEYN